MRTMVGILVVAFAIAAMLLPAAASAVVVESSAAGFMVKETLMVSASPDSVYAALTGRIGSWWNSEHSFSGDARNMSLDAAPGGCLCERLANGGGAVHLTVVYAAPGEALRLAGALGPLQQAGVAGSMTWTFHAAGDSTRTEMTYSVGGYFPGGLDRIAPAVDAVLGEQAARLKSFVETGAPVRK